MVAAAIWKIEKSQYLCFGDRKNWKLISSLIHHIHYVELDCSSQTS